MRDFSINNFSDALNQATGISERDRTLLQAQEIVAIEGLNENSVLVDLGANFGDVLRGVQHSGCKVYAFEPHPVFYDLLNQNYGDDENFIISNKAAWIDDEKRNFYFKHSREALNGGATLMAEKENILNFDYETGEIYLLCEEVECFDISKFIKQLEFVDVLKIDVEGAEYELLYSILNSEAFKNIKSIYVEDHERKMPSARYRELKQKIIEGYAAVNKKLFWW